MWPWFLDRALPGLFVTAIVAALHLIQRRHITRTADRQTAELKAVPAKTCTEGEATMTETPAPQHRSLFTHVPHPHLKHRAEQGPVTVAGGEAGKGPAARFNTRAAVIVTRAVGTMWCAYAFSVLALYGLPAALHNGPAGFVQWASSQFIQLVLLPIIIVGGAVLAEATDRMNKRQFDDVEALLHGQSEQAAHLAAQDDKILTILTQIEANTALTEQVKAALTASGTAPADGGTP
jgi:hypothetical protein